MNIVVKTHQWVIKPVLYCREASITEGRYCVKNRKVDPVSKGFWKTRRKIEENKEGADRFKKQRDKYDLVQRLNDGSDFVFA